MVELLDLLDERLESLKKYDGLFKYKDEEMPEESADDKHTRSIIILGRSYRPMFLYRR